MVGGNHPDSIQIKAPSAQRTDLLSCLEKGLSGKGSQGTDDSGLNGLDLSLQKRKTGGDLIRFGITVLRGSAFDDIGNVDFFTLEIDRLDDLGQQLPGLSNKGSALDVFIVPGTFSDEHQDSPFISFSEDKALSRPVKLAPFASFHLLTDGLEG